MDGRDAKSRVRRVQEGIPVVAGLRWRAANRYYIERRNMRALLLEPAHDELLEHRNRAGDETDGGFDIRP